MTPHLLFPVLVTEHHYNQKEEFKQLFYDNIFKYMNEDGISNEETKHVNLHHESNYSSLFTFASDAAKAYVATLNINPDLFEFNVVKTWMNITRDYSTPTHNHSDAHLSFTYYINLPEDCAKPIRFYNYSDRHEPYPGMIKFNNPLRWDVVNSYAWQFMPVEGQMFVFPASLPHDTVGSDSGNQVGSSLEKGCKTVEDLQQRRICLAGDILLTFKDRANKPMGLQPISEWRTFK